MSENDEQKPLVKNEFDGGDNTSEKPTEKKANSNSSNNPAVAETIESIKNDETCIGITCPTCCKCSQMKEDS